MDLVSGIAKSRRRLGMSQIELAQKSGICLATLQNLESGRNLNPSIQVVESILNAMGFIVQCRVSPVDWDQLSDLGVPLSKIDSSRSFPQKTVSALCEHLRRACLSLVMEPLQDDYERKLHSVQATLWALKTHYPNIYARAFSKQPTAGEILESLEAGKVLKLRRIALGTLCRYL